jgi:hypothetical protein
MGGPINGAPWAGVDAAGHPEQADAIVIPTILQMSSDALSYWTSMTCFYDRYWSPDPDRITLPICMFHVTKISASYSVETSKKRIILYEPQGDENLTAKDMSDQLRENVMRSIIENSVKQPTTYNLEIIVPFQPIGRYITAGVKTISDMITGISDILGGKNAAAFAGVWEGFFSSVYAALGAAQAASEIAGKLPGMDGASFINMNSLEAMAESCRTLCMKMWTGYEYKYVQITGMTTDKRAQEDDVFRATLTAQEKPVLSVTRIKEPKAHREERSWAAAAVTAVQGALISPLIALTEVKKAAGGGTSGLDMIKNALGG